MLNELHSLVERAQCLVGSFDPDRLSGPEARTAVEDFVALERYAAAGRLLAVGRLDETGAWFGDGTFRDLAAWLASISGTTIGAARGASDTARRLRELPASSDALRAGALSPTQADAISGAAKADPDAEASLRDTAKTAGVRGLKTECDRVAAAAASRDSELDPVRTDPRGTVIATLSARRRDRPYRDPRTARPDRADDGRPRTYERELFEDNRKNGRPEHPDAVAFDALVRLCQQSVVASTGPERSTGSRPLAMVIVH